MLAQDRLASSSGVSTFVGLTSIAVDRAQCSELPELLETEIPGGKTVERWTIGADDIRPE